MPELVLKRKKGEILQQQSKYSPLESELLIYFSHLQAPAVCCAEPLDDDDNMERKFPTMKTPCSIVSNCHKKSFFWSPRLWFGTRSVWRNRQMSGHAHGPGTSRGHNKNVGKRHRVYYIVRLSAFPRSGIFAHIQDAILWSFRSCFFLDEPHQILMHVAVNATAWTRATSH